VTTLDPDDDTLTRYLVQHYRFDANRGERCLVVIGAFSTQREALKFLKRKSKELLGLKSAGLADTNEYICSSIMRAGHAERATETRMAIRKMKSSWITQGLSKKQTNGKPDPLPKEE